jgi:ankyrin repeat protein
VGKKRASSAESGANSIELVAAARRGDRAQVESLLAKGVNVDSADGPREAPTRWTREWYSEVGLENIEQNSTTPLGRTALIWAARQGHAEIVDVLVNAGADVRARDSFNLNALMMGALSGSLETVQLLLAAGAPVNLTDFNGATALHLALEKKHFAIADALMVGGADINMPTKSGETALTLAGGKGDAHLLGRLLKAGADPNISSKHNCPLNAVLNIHRSDFAPARNGSDVFRSS